MKGSKERHRSVGDLSTKEGGKRREGPAGKWGQCTKHEKNGKEIKTTLCGDSQYTGSLGNNQNSLR